MNKPSDVQMFILRRLAEGHIIVHSWYGSVWMEPIKGRDKVRLREKIRYATFDAMRKQALVEPYRNDSGTWRITDKGRSYL